MNADQELAGVRAMLRLADAIEGLTAGLLKSRLAKPPKRRAALYAHEPITHEDMTRPLERGTVH